MRAGQEPKAPFVYRRVPSRPDVLPDPPRLSKGLRLYPVKPELAETLNRCTEQFRAIFGLR
jgi:hypothetical protein